MPAAPAETITRKSRIPRSMAILAPESLLRNHRTYTEEKAAMSQRKGMSRRTVIKGALAGAASTGLAGFRFVSYGQSDVIRIGHLTARTGFLLTLGVFAV